MSSADFQTQEESKNINIGMNQRMDQMQSNPTSSGGTAITDVSSSPQQQQSAQNTGSGMFGQ